MLTAGLLPQPGGFEGFGLFGEAIDSHDEVGKRLDFLLQEFNREANTVLSKSTEIPIKEAALAIKAEVEKLREQVQNVE